MCTSADTLPRMQALGIPLPVAKQNEERDGWSEICVGSMFDIFTALQLITFWQISGTKSHRQTHMVHPHITLAPATDPGGVAAHRGRTEGWNMIVTANVRKIKGVIGGTVFSR